MIAYNWKCETPFPSFMFPHGESSPSFTVQDSQSRGGVAGDLREEQCLCVSCLTLQRVAAWLSACGICSSKGLLRLWEDGEARSAYDYMAKWNTKVQYREDYCCRIPKPYPQL